MIGDIIYEITKYLDPIDTIRCVGINRYLNITIKNSGIWNTYFNNNEILKIFNNSCNSINDIPCSTYDTFREFIECFRKYEALDNIKTKLQIAPYGLPLPHEELNNAYEYISIDTKKVFPLLFCHGITSRYKQIDIIPTEIGMLTNLKYLILSYDDINVIPTEIGLLTNLVTLDLSNNNIKIIPTEINQLTGLTSLNLSDNNISSLPDIQLLTNLDHLCPIFTKNVK